MTSHISVAMCTCNGARFIEEQIHSICEQTRPPREVVVRDDASDDDTVVRLKVAWKNYYRRHSVDAPHLKLEVNSRRVGVAANFAAALSACDGDFIALSDQDDRWSPSRLEHLMHRVEGRPGAMLLHGDAHLVDEQGRGLKKTLFEALQVSNRELRGLQGERAFDVLLDRNLVTGATTLIRRELLTLALPMPEFWLHDEWLGVVAAAIQGLTVEQTALLDYRQHTANQIGARQESWRSGLNRIFAPRAGEQAYRAARAAALVTRLQALGSAVAPDKLRQAQSKLEHHEMRAALPASRFARLQPVLREFVLGRYHHFGRGWKGAVKDLLEAA